MRDYSKVSGTFWIGPTGKRLRKKGLEAQLVALYLMTSPHSNMLGLYYLPISFLAHETGLGLEGAEKGLIGAIEAQFCAYDHDAEMVWVYEMASYQIGEQLKQDDKQCLGVQKQYNELPENQHLCGFYEKYSLAFHMTRKRGGASPSQGGSKPLRSQEQEQEQETGTAPSARGAGVPPPTNPPGNPADEMPAADVLKQAVVFSDENPRASPGEVSKAMRTFGINSNPGDMRIVAVAEAGVSAATVQAACEEAKRAKKGEAIPVGFVLSIIERWAREARELDVAGADRKARGKSSGREDGRKAAAKAVFGDAPSSRRIKDVN